jgi:extradiol dioxygenase family protein
MQNKTFHFHMSLPCKEIHTTRKFYEQELDFEIGRNAYSWFDLNLFGNQITFTEDNNYKISTQNYKFEEQVLPTFHFGVIVDLLVWEQFLKRFSDKDYFAIGSRYFLSDQTGEHQSFFIKDPNDYHIEFKTFFRESEIFERNK